MAWEQHYIWIYRTQAGIKARVLDEERFAEALRAPGHHVCEVESPAQRITYNVAYPNEWDAAEAHYLVDTQIKHWPIYNSGDTLDRAQGGEGGPEQIKQHRLTDY